MDAHEKKIMYGNGNDWTAQQERWRSEEAEKLRRYQMAQPQAPLVDYTEDSDDDREEEMQQKHEKEPDEKLEHEKEPDKKPTEPQQESVKKPRSESKLEEKVMEEYCSRCKKKIIVELPETKDDTAMMESPILETSSSPLTKLRSPAKIVESPVPYRFMTYDQIQEKKKLKLKTKAPKKSKREQWKSIVNKYTSKKKNLKKPDKYDFLCEKYAMLRYNLEMAYFTIADREKRRVEALEKIAKLERQIADQKAFCEKYKEDVTKKVTDHCMSEYNKWTTTVREAKKAETDFMKKELADFHERYKKIQERIEKFFRTNCDVDYSVLCAEEEMKKNSSPAPSIWHRKAEKTPKEAVPAKKPKMNTPIRDFSFEQSITSPEPPVRKAVNKTQRRIQPPAFSSFKMPEFDLLRFEKMLTCQQNLEFAKSEPVFMKPKEVPGKSSMNVEMMEREPDLENSEMTFKQPELPEKKLEKTSKQLEKEERKLKHAEKKQEKKIARKKTDKSFSAILSSEAFSNDIDEQEMPPNLTRETPSPPSLWEEKPLSPRSAQKMAAGSKIKKCIRDMGDLDFEQDG